MSPRRKQRTPTRYRALAGVAEWCGVDNRTVSQWLQRYGLAGTPSAGRSPYPCPAPDIELAPGRHGTADVGWADTDERKAEWLAWKASRPGQGAPGQPRPARRREPQPAGAQ